MTHIDELILRTLVFQFDDRVVEIFGGPDNEGRSLVTMLPKARRPPGSLDG
jgi:hypothetical protein